MYSLQQCLCPSLGLTHHTTQGCFIGCPACDHKSGRRQTDLCRLGFNDTLPDYARSVNRNAVRGSEFDIYRHNPWRAPGAAPVADACGLAGGWPWGGDGAEAGNYVNTTHARYAPLMVAIIPPTQTHTPSPPAATG